MDDTPPGRAAQDLGGFRHNVGVSVLGNAAGPLVAVVIAPILAHTLGVNGRGTLAAAVSPYILITTLATLGIPEAVTFLTARQPAIARRLIGAGVRSVAIAGVAAASIVVAASSWLSDGSAEARRLILLACIGVVPALVLGVVRGSAAGLHLWTLVARERALSAAAKLVAVVGLAVAGQLTPLTATLAMIVAPLLGAWPYRQLRSRTAMPAPTTHVRSRTLLRYGLRVWVGSLAGVLLVRLDQAVMAPLAGTFELGLYVAAVSIAEIPLVLSAAVRDVTFSAESAAETGQLPRISRVALVASLGASVVLAAGAPWLVPTVFGAEFEGAVGASLVLLLAVTLGVPGSIAGAGLGAHGRPGLRSVALVVGCAVNIALLIPLASRLGAMGAAWATLAGVVVAANLGVVAVHRLTGERFWDFYRVRADDLRTVWRLGAASIRRLRPGRAARSGARP